MNKLQEICNYLNNCGMNAEIRRDRVNAPYINYGNVNRRKERIQFWLSDNSDSDEIHMYVGKEMGKWYIESSSSVYLNSKYRNSDIENKIEFPNINLALNFIKNITNK